MRLAYCSLVSVFVLVWGALSATGCGAQTSDGGGTDSNTHWLGRCTADADCEGGADDMLLVVGGVIPDEDVATWSDDRIWSELDTRLATRDPGAYMQRPSGSGRSS